MMKKNNISHINNRTALIYPALAGKITGKTIYFLFSVLQVEDVLKSVYIRSVPFSNPAVEGISEWRDHILPVISLEKSLGLNINHSPPASSNRMMVVRSSETNNLKAIFKIDQKIRMVSLPIDCVPVHPDKWIKNTGFISGLFEKEDRLLAVVNIENILNNNPN